MMLARYRCRSCSTYAKKVSKSISRTERIYLLVRGAEVAPNMSWGEDEDIEEVPCLFEGHQILHPEVSLLD